MTEKKGLDLYISKPGGGSGGRDRKSAWWHSICHVRSLQELSGASVAGCFNQLKGKWKNRESKKVRCFLLRPPFRFRGKPFTSSLPQLPAKRLCYKIDKKPFLTPHLRCKPQHAAKWLCHKVDKKHFLTNTVAMAFVTELAWKLTVPVWKEVVVNLQIGKIPPALTDVLV